MRLYHYLEAKWALDDIRRRRLKLSKIDDMNDPYEWKCVRALDEPSQWALEKTEIEIVEIYSVQCYSRSWNNVLMWSHYGDRHKGICLGFDIPDDLTREVQYLESPELVENVADASTEEKIRLIDLLMGAKYHGWSYEQEIRVNASRTDMDEETHQYFVDFSERLKLREVIAGAKFSMSKGPIEDALKGYPGDVQIVKAKRSETRFEIVVDENGFNADAATTGLPFK